jgi:ABC-2 type transport system permease protein
MRFDAIYVFARYELKRALARKKILAFVVFTLLIDTAPYFALASTGASFIPKNAFPYLWVAGVFLPQSLFLQFVGLLIAAGAMSEEYEQGTAELLLSKPVSRSDYFLGKFLGGYSLLLSIIVLNSVAVLMVTTGIFGAQQSLGELPDIIVLQAYSSLLFYSFAFMIGELVRRSSLSYILASAVFFASQLIGVYLSLIYSLTGDSLYRAIDLYLPTSAVISLPLEYARLHLPSSAQELLLIASPPGIIERSAVFSSVIILLYICAALITSHTYFVKADIAKRIS